VHQHDLHGCDDTRCDAQRASAFRGRIDPHVRRPRAACARGEGDWMRRLAIVTAQALAGVAPALGQQQPLRLSLADALARADSASPTVGIARAGIDGAQATWLRARAGYLPQLSASATYSRALASQYSGLTSGTAADTFPAPTNCRHYAPNPSLPLADRLDSIEHGLDCAANGAYGIDFS